MELEQKFLVWKLSDLDTFLNEEEKSFLLRIQHKIRVLRAMQGKSMNSYVVINQDEPYFPAVLKLMEQAEQAPLKAEDTARRRSQGAKDGWEIRRAKQEKNALDQA